MHGSYLNDHFSASDFPLMTAVEMSAVMGSFVDSRVNFVTGSAMTEQNRAELYVDDQVCGAHACPRKTTSKCLVDTSGDPAR